MLIRQKLGQIMEKHPNFCVINKPGEAFQGRTRGDSGRRGMNRRGMNRRGMNRRGMKRDAVAGVPSVEPGLR